MHYERDAVVEGKTYTFTLSSLYLSTMCKVLDGEKVVMEFCYDDRPLSYRGQRELLRQFDAGIDALIAAGGTREAMARLVFGNMTEQKSPSGTM